MGAYFQYTSERQENNIQQYKENFAKATQVFEETSNAMSSAMTLQQILFGNYKEAIKLDVDRQEDSVLTKSARDIYKGYVGARTSLRQNVNVHARKLEIYVDWPFKRRDAVSANAFHGDPI